MASCWQGNQVEVRAEAGVRPIVAARLVAIGSVPVERPMAKFDGKRIVDRPGALEFDVVPKRLGVIGAGGSGSSSAASGVGSAREVTILEACDTFLLWRISRSRRKPCAQLTPGARIRLGAKCHRRAVQGDVVTVGYDKRRDGESSNVDTLVVAVGRRPHRRRVRARRAGCQLDKRGFVEVDVHRRHRRCRTSGRSATSCAGRCSRTRAWKRGVMVAELIAGHVGTMNYRTIPSVIYTAPRSPGSARPSRS